VGLREMRATQPRTGPDCEGDWSLACPRARAREPYIRHSMKVEILCACDSGSTFNGKLDIKGTFSKLTFASFPVVIPQLNVAVRLRFSSPEEEGRHELKLSLFDFDEHLLGPPAVAVLDVRAEADDIYAWSSAVITIRDLRLQSAIDLCLRLEIDGQLVENVEVFVKQAFRSS